MSRRRDRRHTGERPDRPGRADRAGRLGGPGRSDRPGRPDHKDPRAGRRDREARAGILRDVAILVAAFASGAGAAELFGAANLGVAFGVGQVVFALTLIVLLTRE
jgi:hypothetical protein